MKKHWKRRPCLFLCLALLAALFPSGVSLASGVAMGRYVETVLDLPDGTWQAFTQAGGTVYAVDASGETLLRSLDLAANNWETLPTGHDEGSFARAGRHERHCRSRGWNHLPVLRLGHGHRGRLSLP